MTLKTPHVESDPINLIAKKLRDYLETTPLGPYITKLCKLINIVFCGIYDILKMLYNYLSFGTWKQAKEFNNFIARVEKHARAEGIYEEVSALFKSLYVLFTSLLLEFTLGCILTCITQGFQYVKLNPFNANKEQFKTMARNSQVGTTFMNLKFKAKWLKAFTAGKREAAVMAFNDMWAEFYGSICGDENGQRLLRYASFGLQNYCKFIDAPLSSRTRAGLRTTEITVPLFGEHQQMKDHELTMRAWDRAKNINSYNQCISEYQGDDLERQTGDVYWNLKCNFLTAKKVLGWRLEKTNKEDDLIGAYKAMEEEVADVLTSVLATTEFSKNMDQGITWSDVLPSNFVEELNHAENQLPKMFGGRNVLKL